MGRGLRKLFLIAAGFGLAAVCVLSIKVLEPAKGQILVVQDIRNGEIADLYKGRVNFAWQGSFPAWFSLYTISTERLCSGEIKIPIPPMENLKSDQYSVRIPVSVSYSILLSQFKDFSDLKNGAKDLDESIIKTARGFFSRETATLLSPIYRREALSAGLGQILGAVLEKMKADLALRGVSVKRLDLSGSPTMPDIAAYADGVAHLSRLRASENENEREMKNLTSRMEREKILNEELYSRLNRISEIIKKNPDIIKYIYIDKISAGQKSVNPAEGLNFMKNLDEGKAKIPARSGEIDNLK